MHIKVSGLSENGTINDNLPFLLLFLCSQIITREEASKRRMTILECELNLPLPELIGDSTLLCNDYVKKVSSTFNPLKMIWFCYNTHFPLAPTRVYSGLVFNGLTLNMTTTKWQSEDHNKKLDHKKSNLVYSSTCMMYMYM